MKHAKKAKSAVKKAREAAGSNPTKSPGGPLSEGLGFLGSRGREKVLKTRKSGPNPTTPVILTRANFLWLRSLVAAPFLQPFYRIHSQCPHARAPTITADASAATAPEQRNLTRKHNKEHLAFVRSLVAFDKQRCCLIGVVWNGRVV